MENHNTHIVSEQSKGGHGYKYDNFGNIIIDSIDDLIYDKFVDVKRKKNPESDTKKFIKNIINKDESPVTPKNEEKKENSDSDSNESDEKNQKRKSLININMIDNSKSENEEEEEESEESERDKKNNNKKNDSNLDNGKSKMNNNSDNKRKSNLKKKDKSSDNDEINYKEGQKNNKNKNMDKQESNDDSEEEKNNSKKKILESKPEKKKENIQQPKNDKNLKSQSEEESEEESEEKESEKIKQDSVQKRFSTLIRPSLKVTNPKSKHTLNHSDDPVFNIKKVKDLKNMYNKKCFISPNQAEVQIKAITELKYEDNTINETAKFSYLTKRKRRHKKLKVEKQSEHSISPSKKSNIYDSSDEDYPYDISQEMKNYKINQLNPYN